MRFNVRETIAFFAFCTGVAISGAGGMVVSARAQGALPWDLPEVIQDTPERGLGFIVEEKPGEGIWVSSPDQRFKFGFGGYLQLDMQRVVDTPEGDGSDQAALRSARFRMAASLAQAIQTWVTIEMAHETELVDVAAEVRWSEHMSMRVGQMRPPVGWEKHQSHTQLGFMEKSTVGSLLPERDLGLMFLGRSPRGIIDYKFGIWDGSQDVEVAESRAAHAFNLGAHVALRPFRAAGVPELEDFVIGSYGSVGSARAGSASARLYNHHSAGDQVWFRWQDDVTGAEGRETQRLRYGFHLNWNLGPVGLGSEYVATQVDVYGERGPVSLTHHGYVAHAAWRLFGALDADDGDATPISTFNLRGHDLGALEFAVRFSGLMIDSQAFTLGLAGLDSSQALQAMALGLNWYASPRLKFQLNYERTHFEGGVLPVEHLFGGRVQMRF